MKAAHSPASITPGPVVADESHPALHASVSEPVQKPMELRPHAGTGTSNTLRAVILGGKSLAPRGEGATAANVILAPHVNATSGSTASVVLAPEGRATVTVPRAPEIASVQMGGERRAAAESSLADPSGKALAKNVDFEALQRLFMTDAALDLAVVAARVATLPGVHACTISAAGESAQAGHFPSGLDAVALRDIALDPHGGAAESVTRLNAGAVAITTMVCGERGVGIFLREKASVAVVIDARGFVAGVRERIASVTDCLVGAACVE